MCAEGGIGQLSSALDEGLHFPYPTVWGGGSGCHPPKGSGVLVPGVPCPTLGLA